MTARVSTAARGPHMGDRQPRVLPTASTMVNASTNSTVLATNAGRAAIVRARTGFIRSLPDMQFSEQAGPVVKRIAGEGFSRNVSIYRQTVKSVTWEWSVSKPAVTLPLEQPPGLESTSPWDLLGAAWRLSYSSS